jgi:hypothetical protein
MKLVMLGVFLMGASTLVAQSNSYVLKAARLFDGASGKLTTPGMVIVSNGVIQSVGGTGAPAGATIIDLGDATLLPGSRNLADKGLTKVASGGDVIVAYLVIVGNNASPEAVNDYFGYGRDAAALEDKAQDAYSSSKNPNYFEAGTLLVDIVDAKTYKVLKRAYVVRPLLSNPTAEVRAERIQEAVDAVLKDLRIAR